MTCPGRTCESRVGGTERAAGREQSDWTPAPARWKALWSEGPQAGEPGAPGRRAGRAVGSRPGKHTQSASRRRGLGGPKETPRISPGDSQVSGMCLGLRFKGAKKSKATRDASQGSRAGRGQGVRIGSGMPLLRRSANA